MMSLEAETNFGLALLKQLPADESLVLSPLSVAFALALVHSGAAEKARKEIRNALAQNATDKEMVEYFVELMKNLQKDDNVVVRIADRLFVRNGFQLKQPYLDEIAEKYSAQATKLNFNDGFTSAETVNVFVRQMTKGMIRQIVNEADFQETDSLLVNTLYLDAKWNEVFSHQETRKKKFHVNLIITKRIDFMCAMGKYRLYLENDDIQMLSLEYKDKDYRFSVILPKKKLFRNDLSSFRSHLTAEKLQKLFQNVMIERLEIYLPKIKIEREMEMTRMIQNVGIKELLSPGNLDGIANGMKVSKIVHKAVIDVDENGTKAAAVTCSMLKGYIPDDTKTIEFKANRPFLYFLTFQNHILFEGQFCG